MYTQLFAFLLLACHVISNESHVISENVNTVGVETSPTSRAATRPTGYVTFSDVNAAYKVHEEEEISWDQARDRCIAEGAHLAIPDSVEKLVHIKSLKTPSDHFLHIGIYRTNSNNPWVRVDNGLPATSVPWRQGKPDSFGNCVATSISVDRLSNAPCDWGGEHYVCEKSI